MKGRYEQGEQHNQLEAISRSAQGQGGLVADQSAFTSYTEPLCETGLRLGSLAFATLQFFGSGMDALQNGVIR